MPSRHRKVQIIVVLLLALLTSTYISVVSPATGYIRINGTAQSAPNQQVATGSNINLYFGDVIWSSSHLFLFLSYNANPVISTGDFVFTPRFYIYDVTNTTATQTYSDDHGSWTVGYDWINGTIPSNVPVGNYSIKAFDEITENVAVSDTFIDVFSVLSASLNLSPSSGPGGVAVQFTGSGYQPFQQVTISYYDSSFDAWRFFGLVTADSSGMIALNSEMPDLRKSIRAFDSSEEFTPISFRTETGGIVYAYGDYNQYSRGLKTVGNITATGLYGNGTNLVSSVKVEAGDSLALSGKWFHSSSVIYVRWDGVAVVGTKTTDEWRDAVIIGNTIASSSGSFETAVTVPQTDPGEHYLAIEDSETIVIIRILVFQGSLQISPSSGPGGVPIQFSGSGYPASTSVTVSYYDPTFGSWNEWVTTTADSLGNIAFTSEVPDLRKSVPTGDCSETYTAVSFRTEIAGNVYCYADYNQYSRGLTKVGSLAATGLYGNGTNLASASQSVSVTKRSGDSLALSGKWFHSSSVIYVRWDGVAVVGTKTTDEWRDAVIIGNTIASSSGSFDITVTVPTADTGEHYVAIEDSETILIVKINVESQLSPTPTPTSTPAPTSSPSPTPTPTTPKANSSLSLFCKGTTTSSDLKAEISGKLSSSGIVISGESVLISYSVTGGASWESLTSVTTDANGDFLAVWMPSVTGSYLIRAKWEGNSTFTAVETTVNLALTPYSEQNVFSVTSNSTLSKLFFNSTSKELSFTASGPSGTTGYVTVYIPESLVSDISDLKVYSDQTLISYNHELLLNSWIISFSYSHSAHQFVIELSSPPEAIETPINDLLIFATVSAIIVAIAIIIMVFRRKRQPKENSNP